MGFMTFRRRDEPAPQPAYVNGPPADGVDVHRAYEQGRREGAADAQRAFEKGRDSRSRDLRRIYEMGRRDEKADRPRHPLGMTVLVLAAAIGFVLLALVAVNGSFSSAGSVVDQNLSVAADRATQAVHDATSQDGTQTPAT